MNRLTVKIKNRLKPLTRVLIYARIRGAYLGTKLVATLCHVPKFREIPASCHKANARYLTLRCPWRGLITGSVL